MCGAVDTHVLADALPVVTLGVLPPRLQLLQREFVRRVPIYLVRRHEEERGLRRRPARRFQEVQRTDRIHVEVIEWALGREVVTGLRSGEVIAVTNTFSLKAELMKALAED